MQKAFVYTHPIIADCVHFARGVNTEISDVYRRSKFLKWLAPSMINLYVFYQPPRLC